MEGKHLQTYPEIERRVAICTLSGGLDSAVAAAIMKAAGFKVHFLFFDWGQKTLKRELDCAKKLAKHYDADLKVVEVPLFKDMPGVSMTKAETQTTAINEYVPNRNAVLEAQAVAYAEALKAGAVSIGSNGGDLITPDSSLPFIQTMQTLIEKGTVLKPPIKLIAPLMDTNKTGVVERGLALGVPMEFTWSCHNNIKEACGVCSNCKERLKAFEENGEKDPISYERT